MVGEDVEEVGSIVVVEVVGICCVVVGSFFVDIFFVGICFVDICCVEEEVGCSFVGGVEEVVGCNFVEEGDIVYNFEEWDFVDICCCCFCWDCNFGWDNFCMICFVFGDILMRGMNGKGIEIVRVVLKRDIGEKSKREIVLGVCFLNNGSGLV